MRNRLVTPFWQKAAKSLPSRYVGHLERAERWDLAISELVDLLSHAKSRIAKALHMPAHSA